MTTEASPSLSVTGFSVTWCFLPAQDVFYSKTSGKRQFVHNILQEKSNSSTLTSGFDLIYRVSLSFNFNLNHVTKAVTYCQLRHGQMPLAAVSLSSEPTDLQALLQSCLLSLPSVLPRGVLPALNATWLWNLSLPLSFACLAMLFCNHSDFSPKLSWRQGTNTGFSDPGCMCIYVRACVFLKCIDLFFCFAVSVCFFNPSSCGHRMTQIGNTISGVTGLRSVWWTLVMLSPSLLTPGSKCMHGRSLKNPTKKAQQ